MKKLILILILLILLSIGIYSMDFIEETDDYKIYKLEE